MYNTESNIRKDIPIIRLPNSDEWESGYDWGSELDKKFPNQDAIELGYACAYNDYGPTKEHHITKLTMHQQGQNDGGNWIWCVELNNGTVWLATGGCDYTGWDCQSSLDWECIEKPGVDDQHD